MSFPDWCLYLCWRRRSQHIFIAFFPLFPQAKGKERQWLKNQALGELDDAKIIDGLTGEKAIYKRRGELDPEVCMCLGVCIAADIEPTLKLVFFFPPPFPSHTSKHTQTRLTHIILTFICQTLHSSGVSVITPCISAQAHTQFRVFSSRCHIYSRVNTHGAEIVPTLIILAHTNHNIYVMFFII